MSTHGNSVHQLKNEGLKCRHIKPIGSCSAEVLTHEVQCRHITASFLNAELSESAFNEPQLPSTGKITSNHYIQASKCIYTLEDKSLDIH